MTANPDITQALIIVAICLVVVAIILLFWMWDKNGKIE